MSYRSPMERAMAERVQPFRQRMAEPAPAGQRLDLTNPAGYILPAEQIRQAVISALEAGETRYTARTGIEPLREAIAARSTSEGFPTTPETCVVTNGGSEGLFIALQSLIIPGDLVALVGPVAPQVAALVRFVGGRVERVPGLPLSGLDSASVVVLTAASGIDGRLTANNLLAELLEDAAGSGTIVILDRSAVPDCYDQPQPFPRPDLAADIVTIGSFSGAFGLAGWRAGYFTAPERLIARLAGLKESMSISTTTPTQFAMLAALQDADAVLETARAETRARRNMVTGLLQAHGVEFETPGVYPGFLIDVRQTGIPDDEVARRLEIEHGVRVEAGSTLAQSLEGFIRIDLGTQAETLRAGVEQIAQLLTEEAR